MAVKIPQPKDPYDERPYSVGFPGKLTTDETITDFEVAVVKETDLIISDKQVDGHTIKFMVSGGRPKEYKIEVSITTSLGRKYQGTALLTVAQL